MIRKLKQGSFLDIGCSTGTWGQYWIQYGWEVYGVDIDKSHLKQAENKGVKTTYCDLNTSPLPYDDNFFDLIFAGEVMEHLIDTDGFIKEVYRCVKPGGFALLTTPNLVSFENRIRSLLGFYPKWVDYRLQGAGHIRAYTPNVLKRQLKSFGFKIVKMTGNWVPFIPQKLIDDIKAPWLSITGTVAPGLAMDIIVLVQK
ncbi:class I SAM-dependent methyltransferase [candidate division KSB1 bacterium]|nr:class I SAM-dependent methyltransferase [candidate division KSB1 bacterium]